MPKAKAKTSRGKKHLFINEDIDNEPKPSTSKLQQNLSDSDIMPITKNPKPSTSQSKTKVPEKHFNSPKSSTIPKDSDTRLYCVCRQANDESKMMIQCDTCFEWYHPNCIGLDDDNAQQMDEFMCKACVEILRINPSISEQGLIRLQGRVSPKEGWCDKVILKTIKEECINNFISSKSHLNQGWALFREGAIVRLETNENGSLSFVRAVCEPAMRKNNYMLHLCFATETCKIKWATCSCPAGISGQCKHTSATIYELIDLARLGAETILKGSCTSRLQMWHVKRPQSDEPLLFSDIKFVKHDFKKPEKAELGCIVKNFDPMPDWAKPVSKEQIEQLVYLFKKIDNLPVIDTIESNGCIPVLPRTTCQFSSKLYLELWNGIENTLDYCLPSEYLNLTPEEINVLKIISVNLAESKIIEQKTRLQSKNSFWFKQRAIRLTSSNFGTFCKLKKETDRVNTFVQKRKFFTTPSVRHGINHEDAAFALFVSRIKVDDHAAVGLLVNPKFPFLGASPDRVILTDDKIHLVEIKCPFSLYQKKTTVAQRAQEKDFYLTFNESSNKYELKENHDYFYQTQGQLLVSNVDECFFVVYVPPSDLEYAIVKRNDSFINSIMYPKLCTTYYDFLLPYFAQELASGNNKLPSKTVSIT